jgi:hypothetical protein
MNRRWLPFAFALGVLAGWAILCGDTGESAGVLGIAVKKEGKHQPRLFEVAILMMRVSRMPNLAINASHTFPYPNQLMCCVISAIRRKGAVTW